MRYPRLCYAIEHHRLLHFSYDGETRLVEPHAYGLTRTDDEICIPTRSWEVPAQAAYFSSTRYTAPNCTRIEVAVPRHRYRRNDKAMYEISASSNRALVTFSRRARGLVITHNQWYRRRIRPTVGTLSTRTRTAC
jgi:hypothetical protein